MTQLSFSRIGFMVLLIGLYFAWAISATAYGNTASPATTIEPVLVQPASIPSSIGSGSCDWVPGDVVGNANPADVYRALCAGSPLK
jgi:hypothetical protein